TSRTGTNGRRLGVPVFPGRSAIPAAFPPRRALRPRPGRLVPRLPGSLRLSELVARWPAADDPQQPKPLAVQLAAIQPALGPRSPAARPIALSNVRKARRPVCARRRAARRVHGGERRDDRL